MTCNFEKMKKFRSSIEGIYDTSYVQDEDGNIYIKIELPFESIFYEGSKFSVYIGYEEKRKSYFVTDLSDSLCHFTEKHREEIPDYLINNAFNSINGIEKDNEAAVAYFDFNGFDLSGLETAISKIVLYMSYSFVRYYLSVY